MPSHSLARRHYLCIFMRARLLKSPEGLIILISIHSPMRARHTRYTIRDFGIDFNTLAHAGETPATVGNPPALNFNTLAHAGET